MPIILVLFLVVLHLTIGFMNVIRKVPFSSQKINKNKQLDDVCVQLMRANLSKRIIIIECCILLLILRLVYKWGLHIRSTSDRMLNLGLGVPPLVANSWWKRTGLEVKI